MKNIKILLIVPLLTCFIRGMDNPQNPDNQNDWMYPPCIEITSLSKIFSTNFEPNSMTLVFYSKIDPLARSVHDYIEQKNAAEPRHIYATSIVCIPIKLMRKNE